MKHADGFDANSVTAHRRDFLAGQGMDFDATSLVRLSYDREDYCRYGRATDQIKGQSMLPDDNTPAFDALTTDEPNHALFLPVADCCALALVDVKKRKIVLSHIGRHSAEQNGAKKSVRYMVDELGSDLVDLRAWLGPAAGKANFPIFALDNMGLHEAIVRQLRDAGVGDEQIEVSSVDTTTDERYFSHSEFLKGNRIENGRFAVAMMINS
jgi:copper oxidase (laccase) domain-containing protein